MKQNKNLKAIFHFLVMSFLIASPCVSYAWIPPSNHVIKSLAKKHNPLDEAKFTNKVTFYNRSGQPSKSLTETLIFTNAEHVSIRLTTEKGAFVASHSRNLYSAKSGGTVRPVLYDLLYVKNAASLIERFKELGIPLKTEVEIYSEKEGSLPYKPEVGTVGYGRFGSRIGVVLAENVSKIALDRGGAQLWVERNSYLPMRAIFDSTEYVFEQYRSEGGFLYPNSILIKKFGNPWIRIENKTSHVGAGSSKTTTMHPGGDADSEDQDFAQDYFKWIR